MQYRDVLTAVGDLSKLALEIADIGFETVILSHLRRWWLFLLTSRRDVYWVRNASDTSKLRRECGGLEYNQSEGTTFKLEE